jgi:hypothetical protein
MKENVKLYTVNIPNQFVRNFTPSIFELKL